MFLRRFLNRLLRLRVPVSYKRSLRQELTDRGLQYYIAARYATAAGFIPVAGSLFHHAIEMFLKGYLSETLAETELLKLSHSLKRAWRLFKNAVRDPSLNQLDSTISKLHKFENIRYPDMQHGMLAVIEFGKPSTGQLIGTGGERQYKISVDELDNLVQLIFTLTKLNPEAFMGPYKNKQDARDFLLRENNHPIWK